MKPSYAIYTSLAVLALAAAAPAISQPFAGPGPGGGMMRGAGPGMGGNPAAHAETRLETLRTQLNLDASQQAAWQAYATAVRAQAADMAEDRAAMRASTGTAPERMAKQAERMREHAAGMSQVAETLRGLYAVLNTDQRAVVDRNFTRGAGMGPGFGPG
jgi:hypothetical protein